MLLMTVDVYPNVLSVGKTTKLDNGQTPSHSNSPSLGVDKLESYDKTATKKKKTVMNKKSLFILVLSLLKVKV
jgi:hypothetical protein